MKFLQCQKYITISYVALTYNAQISVSNLMIMNQSCLSSFCNLIWQKFLSFAPIFHPSDKQVKKINILKILLSCVFHGHHWLKLTFYDILGYIQSLFNYKIIIKK